MIKFLKFATPIFCLTLLTACDSINTNNDAVIESNNQQNTSETTGSVNPPKTQEYVSPLPDSAPVYVVSIEKDAYPPFEFMDDYGNYIGYDFDLIRAIGEEAGFKVQMKPLPFGDILPSLITGDSDIAISALTASEERTSQYDASNPYIQSASNFVVKADSGLQADEQIIDSKVAVQKNGFQHKELENSESNYNLVPVKTNYLAFQSLFTGEADAVYADRTMLYSLSAQFPEHKVNFIPHGEEITLSIFTAQGNNEVMTKVNEGLDKVKANGRYHELNKKWFGDHANDVAVN